MAKPTWSVARRLGVTPTTACRWVAERQDQPPTFARLVRSSVRPEEPRRSGVTIAVGAARILVEPEFDPALLRDVVAALSEVES